MDIKSVGNNSLVDLSGWVEVESAKETQMGEINRVTGRELDDVRQQIEGPAAQCSSLADRLKTEAVRPRWTSTRGPCRRRVRSERNLRPSAGARVSGPKMSSPFGRN